MIRDKPFEIDNDGIRREEGMVAAAMSLKIAFLSFCFFKSISTSTLVRTMEIEE